MKLNGLPSNRIGLRPRIELLPTPPSSFGEIEYGCEYGTVGHSIPNQQLPRRDSRTKLRFQDQRRFNLVAP